MDADLGFTSKLAYLLKPLQVNNNGVVSFDAPVTTYTPEPLPLSGGGILLSPYWADVDTRPLDGGFVLYRQSTDPALLNTARDQIRAIFPVDFQTFTPTFLFIATWDHVGYYNSRTDKVDLLIDESCIQIIVALLIVYLLNPVDPLANLYLGAGRTLL